MNKKEILIKALRGSVAQLNELSTMTEGIDVYNATGHVDTEFLIEALSCVNTFMDASKYGCSKNIFTFSAGRSNGRKEKTG
jgi:hypothetical protein